LVLKPGGVVDVHRMFEVMWKKVRLNNGFSKTFLLNIGKLEKSNEKIRQSRMNALCISPSPFANLPNPTAISPNPKSSLKPA
jgi:hypothetical protein